MHCRAMCTVIIIIPLAKDLAHWPNSNPFAFDIDKKFQIYEYKKSEECGGTIILYQ
jgi:hypothetical protein